MEGKGVDEGDHRFTNPLMLSQYAEDKFLLPLPEMTPLLDTESMFSSLTATTTDQPTGATSSSAVPDLSLPSSASHAPVPATPSALDLSSSSPSTTVEGENYYTPTTSPVLAPALQLSNKSTKEGQNMNQSIPPKGSVVSSLASTTEKSRKRKSFSLESSRTKPSRQAGNIETPPIRVASPPPIAKLSLLQPRDHSYVYNKGMTAMKTGKNPGLRIDSSAEASRKISINDDPNLLPPLTANSIAASTPGSPAFRSSVYSLSFTNNVAVRPRSSSSHSSSPGLFTTSPALNGKEDGDVNHSDQSSPLVSDMGSPDPDAQTTDDYDERSDDDTSSYAATQSNAQTNGALSPAENIGKNARAKSRHFFSNLKPSSKNSPKADDGSSNLFRRNRRVSLADERTRSSAVLPAARSVVSDYPAIPDKGNDSVIGSVDNSSMPQGTGTTSRKHRARFHNFKLHRSPSIRGAPQETSPPKNRPAAGRESKIVIRSAVAPPARPTVSNTWRSNDNAEPTEMGSNERKQTWHHIPTSNSTTREALAAQMSLDGAVMGSNGNNANSGMQPHHDQSTVGASHPLNNRDNRNKPSAITSSMAHIRHGAGKAKDLFGRMRAGNTSDRQSEQQRLSENENFSLDILQRPLVEQTRISRVCKDYDDCNSKTEYWMPALPYRCIDFLNFKGVEEEGLYRVPGSGREVKRWQKRFDTGKSYARTERPLSILIVPRILIIIFINRN